MARHDLSRPIWGKRLQEIREEREQSQTQVADGLNKILGEDSKIKRQTIEHWESGTHYLRSGDLKALADYFGCSPDYFFGITDSTSTDEKLRFICDHTGLSDKAVSVLNQQKDHYPTLTRFLNSFLTSEPCINIIKDLDAAFDSYGIAQSAKCEVDVQHATAMTNLDTKLGLSEAGYQLEGKPDIPRGTVLLEADNAVDYYIDRLTRRFGEFIRKQYFETDKKE